MLTKLNHPNVVKMFFSFQDKNKLFFVLELIAGGEFSEFLTKQSMAFLMCLAYTGFNRKIVTRSLQILRS